MTLAEAKAIIARPAVESMLRRGYTIDTSREVRGGVEYSEDGRTVYLDRNLLPWHFGGRDIPVSPFLCVRAHIEKAVLDAGHPVDHARAVAMCVEDYAVGMQFGEAGVRAYRAR